MGKKHKRWKVKNRLRFLDNYSTCPSCAFWQANLNADFCEVMGHVMMGASIKEPPVIPGQLHEMYGRAREVLDELEQLRKGGK